MVCRVAARVFIRRSCLSTVLNFRLIRLREGTRMLEPGSREQHVTEPELPTPYYWNAGKDSL